MRVLVAVVLLLSASTLGFAQFLDDFVSSEYVFYLDHRGGRNFYRGYWFYRVVDANTEGFFVQNLDLDTGKHMGMKVEISADSHGEPMIADIAGASKSTPPEFAQGYIDLLNYISMYVHNRHKVGIDTSIEDPWDDYSLVYRFNKYLPLFRFSTVTRQGDKEPSIILDRAGMTHGGHGPFFEFRPLAEIKERAYRAPDPLPQAAPIVAHMSGYTINIDRNWRRHDDTPFPSYWVSQQTVRDAVISIESSPWKKMTDLGYKSVSDFMTRMPIATGRTLFDTLSVEEKDGHVKVRFEILDENSRRNFFWVESWLDGERLISINFSGFSSFYYANAFYCDEIMSSCRKE